ncbi:hypothetical protein [Palaeococcus ferrophilus]|uniref:hypothetical protein n=1 Tax=Palaeococcus ferrophilus TaxID=83868 RepID=UPI00064FDE3F|nr:hypothetical protein [Palaeococcus ferrophilus]
MISYIPPWNSIVALAYIILAVSMVLKIRPSAGELIFVILYSISSIAISLISLGYSVLLLGPLLMYGALAYSEKTSLNNLKGEISKLEGKP